MLCRFFKIKLIYAVIIVFLFIFSCTEKRDADSYVIKGKLSNIGASYFFLATEEEGAVKVDTIFVDSKGSFLHEGKVTHMIMASLYFDKKSWATSIFIDKGWNIEIKGDANRPDLIMVTGGNVNDDLTEFKKSNADLFNTKADIIQSVMESDTQVISQSQDIELKNIDFELINRANTYIQKNPGKIASVVLIQDFFKNPATAETLDKKLELLTGDALRFPLTKELTRYSDMQKQSQIGASAPHIQLKNGKKSLDINSFKGKYLYLTFTSRDSMIYDSEIPAMMKAYDNLKNKNVKFVSVVIDAPEGSVAPDSIKWDVYYDYRGWASDALKNYNVTEVPYGILISPEGRILERNIYASGLPAKMDEILKSAAK